MKKLFKWGLLGLLFLFFIGMLGSGENGTGVKESAKNKAGNSSKVEKEEVSEEVEDKYPHFGDGIHLVGKDIEPGTYRAKNPSSNCYYARLSGLTGSFHEILANANTDSPAVVTILASDKAFQSRGCGVWTQDLSPITESKDRFGDGIFIVGVDIEPGTYKSQGQTGCYYARLKDFTGSMHSILANNNTDDPAIVRILPSDKGFQSNGCGYWEKIE